MHQPMNRVAGATRFLAILVCGTLGAVAADVPLADFARHPRGDIHETELGENYLKKAIGEDQALLADRSPISHLDRLRAKVMPIVGGADRRVPVQGKDMHKALSDLKVDHEWIYHLNEGHGYFDVAHTTDMYQKIIAFLDRNIGTGPAVVAPK